MARSLEPSLAWTEIVPRAMNTASHSERHDQQQPKHDGAVQVTIISIRDREPPHTVIRRCHVHLARDQVRKRSTMGCPCQAIVPRGLPSHLIPARTEEERRAANIRQLRVSDAHGERAL